MVDVVLTIIFFFEIVYQFEMECFKRFVEMQMNISLKMSFNNLAIIIVLYNVKYIVLGIKRF